MPQTQGTGATLSCGETWESEGPLAFDSMQLSAVECNYPVHEKELLAIMHALKKFRTNLVGSPFIVRTYHNMLKNFMDQHDLLRCHACWQKFFSQYEFHIEYLPGEQNSVADAFSQLPSQELSLVTAAAIQGINHCG